MLRLYALCISVFLGVTASALAQQPPGGERPENEQRSARSHQDAQEITSSPEPLWLIFELFTDNGRKRIATYCKNDSTAQAQEWSHGYVCEIRITDVYIAIFTGILAVSTIGLIFTGYRTIYTMQRTERRQLRAYVGVKLSLKCKNLNNLRYKPHAIAAGEGPEDFFIVDMTNFGQTPANNTTIWINWRPMPYPQRLPDNFSFEDINSVSAGDVRPIFIEATIFPHQTITEVCQIHDLQPFRDVIAKKVFTYVWGHVDYADIYSIKRTTTFCFQYLPRSVTGEDFIPYEEHNQAR